MDIDSNGYELLDSIGLGQNLKAKIQVLGWV